MKPGAMPMPVALLAERSRNAKSAKDLHDTAYFAWEVSVHLCAAAARPSRPERLQRPSLGTWVDALTLSKERIQDPVLLEVFGLLTEVGTDQRARPSQASQLTLLRALPAYRNRVIGHGSVRMPSYYEHAGDLLRRGLAAAWAGGVFLPPSQELVLLQERGQARATVLRLMGTTPEVLDPRATVVPDAVVAGRLYARDGDAWNELHPWLLFLRREGRDQVLSFDSLRKGRPSYLDYACGEVVRGRRLAAQFPALAGELETVFGQATLSEADEEAERTPADPDHVGNYHLLGEIGRGGMGVVHLARHDTLGRLAAVKRLPPTLAEDDVAVQRFAREIDALARCEHPNVVKILGSGTQAGRPWFAMEYVEGADLSQVARALAETQDFDRAATLACERVGRARGALLGAPEPEEPVAASPPGRSPAPRHRRVARLMRDAARGLHHLHAKGIVHRDIKPANIQLTAHGHRPVIMDLGLAAMSDATHSLTTDATTLLGTLRYMPPEQLTRERAQVDARADVYALGATLHELLTGRPFFDGADVPRLLEQVLHERPAAVRDVRADVPRDLALIVRRATEKEADLRYPSAEALAEDLDAWLDGRPIAARPPSLPYVAGLWVRRNKPLTAALAALVLLAVAGTGLFVWSLEQARKREAGLRRAAEADRARAESLVDYMIGDLRDRLEPIGRLDLLGDIGRRVKAYYETLSETDLPLPVHRRRSAALKQLAHVLREQDDDHAAFEISEAERARVEKLLEQQPDDPGLLLDLADALYGLGRHHLKRHAIAPARDHFERMRDAVAHLLTLTPDDIEAGRRMAECHRELAKVRIAGGEEAAGRRHLKRSLALLRRLHDRAPGNRDIRVQIASASKFQAILEGRAGRHAKAGRILAKAIALLEALLAETPRHLPWREELAHLRVARGNELALSGRLDDAREAFAEALEVFERLATEDPTTPAWLKATTDTRVQMAAIDELQGRPAQALATFEAALATLRRVVARDPSAVLPRLDLAGLHQKLALALQRTGANERATPHLEQAVRLHEELAKEKPADARLQVQLVGALFMLGDHLHRVGEPDEAVPVLERAATIGDPLADRKLAFPGWKRDLHMAHERLGMIHLGRKEIDAAASHFDRHHELAKALLAKRPQDTVRLRDVAISHQHLASVHAAKGEPQAAFEALEHSIDLRQKVVASEPANPRWQGELRGALLPALRAGVEAIAAAEGAPREALVTRALAFLDAYLQSAWERVEVIVAQVEASEDEAERTQLMSERQQWYTHVGFLRKEDPDLAVLRSDARFDPLFTQDR